MLKNVSLLLPCLVSLFWTIFFISNGKKNSRSQRIWLIVVLLFVIVTGIAAFYWFFDGDYGLFYKLDIVDGFVSLSIVPFILLYFTEITGDHNKWPFRQVLLLFLPALLIGGSTAYFYLSVGDHQASVYMKEIMENSENAHNPTITFFKAHRILLHYVYIPVFFLQILTACFYIIRILLSYRRRLDEFFSNVEGKSLDHHWAVLRGLFILLLLLALITQLGYLVYIEYTVGISVFNTLFAATIYYICYHVYRTNYTAESFAHDLAASDQEADQEVGKRPEVASAGEDADHFNKLRERISPGFNRLVNEEKIFLQKDIRLDEIARLLSLNRSYMSRFINEEYGCNFAEFINNKRIDYAKELIRLNPQLSQEQIAEQAGFAYTSTFSRVFKEYAGVTFRRFMQEQGR